MFNSTLRIEALNYDMGTSEFYAILWMGRLEEKKFQNTHSSQNLGILFPVWYSLFKKKKILFRK